MSKVGLSSKLGLGKYFRGKDSNKRFISLSLCLAIGVSACGTTATASTTKANIGPSSWTVDASNPQHNADFPNAKLGALKWSFKEPLATALNQPPMGSGLVGRLRASVRITQTVGNALGVTVVNSILYAETDSGSLFALNIKTGKQLWSYRTTNSLMGNPIVANGMVFVGSGNSNWSYRELVQYKAHQPIQRGTGQNQLVALNATTGKVIWTHPTKFEDMPTPSYLGGTLYEATGGGNIIALNAATGATRFETHIGGFDSMSSPIAWKAPSGTSYVYASFSGPNQVVAVNATTGAIAWKTGFAGTFNTSLGDQVLALDPKTGSLVVNALTNKAGSGSSTTANAQIELLNATTGATKWQTSLGRGPLPAAFKAGVPMIHGGVIYMNSPAGDVMHAVSESTGKILWKLQTHFPGRSAPTFNNGTLYFADGPVVYAVDPATGKILRQTKLGGLFGIVNPVIVGKTMFLDNSFSWIQAVPLSKVAP